MDRLFQKKTLGNYAHIFALCISATKLIRKAFQVQILVCEIICVHVRAYVFNSEKYKAKSLTSRSMDSCDTPSKKLPSLLYTYLTVFCFCCCLYIKWKSLTPPTVRMCQSMASKRRGPLGASQKCLPQTMKHTPYNRKAATPFQIACVITVFLLFGFENSFC